MGFSLGDVGAGLLGGPAGYLAYNAFKNGGSTDVAQVPLETPEQRMAREGLLKFAQEGTYGNYTAGQAYTGSLGDFGLSTLEQNGLNTVGSNMTAGRGALFDSGNQVLMDLLKTDKYNPLNNSGAVQGLTGAIDYNTKQAVTAAKRDAAYTGSSYSTSAVRDLGNVEAQGAIAKNQTLANLYQTYIGQKFGAVPQAFAGQQQINNQDEQRLQDSFTYGGLPRSLNNAKDAAAYAEFQRQRQEKQGQITALSSVAGTNSNFGVPNVSVPKDNPWMDVLGLLAQFGGKVAGGAAGAK